MMRWINHNIGREGCACFFALALVVASVVLVLGAAVLIGGWIAGILAHVSGGPHLR